MASGDKSRKIQAQTTHAAQTLYTPTKYDKPLYFKYAVKNNYIRIISTSELPIEIKESKEEFSILIKIIDTINRVGSGVIVGRIKRYHTQISIVCVTDHPSIKNIMLGTDMTPDIFEAGNRAIIDAIGTHDRCHLSQECYEILLRAITAIIGITYEKTHHFLLHLGHAIDLDFVKINYQILGEPSETVKIEYFALLDYSTGCTDKDVTPIAIISIEQLKVDHCHVHYENGPLIISLQLL